MLRSVPNGKYQRPANAQIIIPHHAHGIRAAKQMMMMTHTKPNARWIVFISVDRGSIPMPATSFDQGPSCPAYCPELGVT